MHVSICDDKKWARDYRYIDMNAGPGIAPICKLDGSPLLFLAAATTARHLPYRALLVEQDQASADQLRARVAGYGRAEVRCGDHKVIVPAYIAGLTRSPSGLIYHDPNGRPSFQALSEVFVQPQAKRLDLLLYCGAAWIKRWNGWYFNRSRPDFTLQAGLDAINKDYYIIREPIDSAQWTYIIATNWSDFPKWKKQGFYDITSREGKAILAKLNYRAKLAPEADQQALPFDEGDDDDSLTDS